MWRRRSLLAIASVGQSGWAATAGSRCVCLVKECDVPIRPENRDKYPADWPAIRQEVLDRDGHRCLLCKVPNHRWGIRWRAGTFTAPHVVLRAIEPDGYRATRPCENEHETAEAIKALMPGVYIEGRGLWRRSPDQTQCVQSGRLVQIVLTIAHLDHDPANNGQAGNRPNLAALCQRCHNRHDGPHRRETAGRTRDRRRGQGRMFDDMTAT